MFTKESLYINVVKYDNQLKLDYKKLSNERFVQNAKQEVVDMERKKKADAEEKIKALTKSIANL